MLLKVSIIFNIANLYTQLKNNLIKDDDDDDDDLLLILNNDNNYFKIHSIKMYIF